MPDDTCRLPGCEETPRGREPGIDLYAAQFCSTGCELKYDHAESDAQDARRDRDARRPGW